VPLAYERLRDLELPEQTHALTRRGTAFYALAVGMGQDPLDAAQLAFVDPDHRALVALPSLATVLAHRALWLRDPSYGADFSQAVNGEQRIVLHRPLPVEGTLAARTRVTGVVDKGAGRGALVFTARTIVDAASATPIATVETTTFLRGDGGFGGPDGPARAPHRVPERAPDVRVDLATRPEQALYYRFNGDDNPLHVDPQAAERAGFPRPILHGLCTLGVVTHALVRARCGYDPTRMRSLEARFAAPVFPGETIRTEMWNDGSFQARVIERDTIVVSNGLTEVVSPSSRDRR
jgi:acyl dehydratase